MPAEEAASEDADKADRSESDDRARARPASVVPFAMMLERRRTTTHNHRDNTRNTSDAKRLNKEGCATGNVPMFHSKKYHTRTCSTNKYTIVLRARTQHKAQPTRWDRDMVVIVLHNHGPYTKAKHRRTRAPPHTSENKKKNTRHKKERVEESLFSGASSCRKLKLSLRSARSTLDATPTDGAASSSHFSRAPMVVGGFA